jgi:hypothetical protein
VHSESFLGKYALINKADAAGRCIVGGTGTGDCKEQADESRMARALCVAPAQVNIGTPGSAHKASGQA